MIALFAMPLLVNYTIPGCITSSRNKLNRRPSRSRWQLSALLWRIGALFGQDSIKWNYGQRDCAAPCVNCTEKFFTFAAPYRTCCCLGETRDNWQLRIKIFYCSTIYLGFFLRLPADFDSAFYRHIEIWKEACALLWAASS